MKYISFFIILFFFPVANSVSGQQTNAFEQETAELFYRQRFDFPQEKAYLHLDRNHYVAGDTVWFRGYLADASVHIPDTVSRYLYARLADPVNRIAQEVKIPHRNGAYAGYFALPDDMPEGYYTVSAYTMFMWNAGPDYFFRTPIRISDPRASEVEVNAEFSYAPQRRLTAELRFANRHADVPILPKNVRMGIDSLGELSYHPNKSNAYAASFRFPQATEKQNHLLVEYDKSRRYVAIPAPESEFDVSFFPEGGHLLAGAFCTVGVKALNPDGLSEEVSGEVFDSAGNAVGSFDTPFNGMGRIVFYAIPGERYHAVCTNRHGHSKRFDLPEIRNDAVGLRLNRRGSTMILSVVRPEGFEGFRRLSLVIHSRGIVCYANEIENQERSLYFDSGTLRSGVYHVLLLDENRRVLSERLFFCLNDDQARVRFATDRTVYKSRERVDASVTLTAPDGTPLRGGFSVSVTDDGDLPPDTARNILTELLLTSELRGNIESPARYFRLDDPGASEALDILMLTQGWRRYDVPKLLQGEIRQPETPLEIGNEITGRVKALLSSRPSAHTPVYLLIPKEEAFVYTDTDENGRFVFSGFEFADSSTLLLHALSRKRNGRVELLADELPRAPRAERFPSPIRLKRQDFSPGEEAFVTKSDRKWVLENGIRTIQLEAIEIKAKKEQNEMSSIYSGLADNVYDTKFMEEWNINTLEQLLTMTVGVQVNGGRITIRGSDSSPLFVVDDVLMPDDFDWQMEVNMFNVERVEVVKGAGAAIFGVRGGSGAILIYTKRGGGTASERIQFNRAVLTPLGTQKPAEFYSPKYVTPDQGRLRPDLRTTIYWNPDLRTDSEGNASFGFYTADGFETTYSVVIEGLTDDGQIIRALEKIVRE